VSETSRKAPLCFFRLQKKHGRAKGDILTHGLTGIAALCATLLLASVFLEVAVEGWNIIPAVGLGEFLFEQTWMPIDFGTGASFGIFNFICATLVTSFAGLLIAAVLSMGAALYLACATKTALRRAVYALIDLLAGVPSVVYGFIGLTILVPLFLDAGVPSGNCVLAAALVLTVMLLPFLVSSLAESFMVVKERYSAAVSALGINTWYTACSLILPHGLREAAPSFVVAFARAAGETMAVMMVVGNANLFPELLGKGETIAALIALEMGTAANGSNHMHALFAAGFVLLVLTGLADALATLFKNRVAKRHNSGAKHEQGRPTKQRNVIKYDSRIAKQLNSQEAKRHDANQQSKKATSHTHWHRTSLTCPSWFAPLTHLWALVSLLAIVGMTLFLFAYVFTQGAGALSWEFLTSTPGGAVLGSEGGIFPAIIGSAWFAGVALLMAGPLALGCALWRTFYCKHPKLNSFVGHLLALGAGIPSIVLGLFAYAILIRNLGVGRSIFVSGFALALMILPYMEVRIEKALREIPRDLLQTAYALGCSNTYLIRTLAMPLCRGDILSAFVLGGCFAFGAAAPLIFTGGVAYAPVPSNVFEPAMALPLHLYLMLAQGTTIPQVYATAFVLMSLVLVVNLAVSFYSHYRRKSWTKSL
jgi:phosphate transport system permease protein